MLQVQMPGALRPHQPGKSEHKTTTQGLTTPKKWNLFLTCPHLEHLLIQRLLHHRMPPRFRLRLERNRKPSGENPRPPSLQHQRSTTTCQSCGCLFRANELCRGLAQFLATWKPLVRGIGAPDLLKRSVSIFRAFHALTGICWHFSASESLWTRFKG